MMWGFGNGMGVWGYAVMTVSMVLFWGFIIVGAIALCRAARRAQWSSDPAQQTPREVLARRYATGEIDETEYRRRLDVLQGRTEPVSNP